MTDLILAIDQGTTGSTVLLLNRSVEVVAMGVQRGEEPVLDIRGVLVQDPVR